MHYPNKKIIVTGSGSEPGRQIARAFANLGATVITTDKDYAAGEFAHELRAMAGRECRFYHTDLALASECEKFMAEVFANHGDIDILINSTIPADFTDLTEQTTENWDYILAAALRAPFLTAREFVKSRKNRKTDYGRIINIASTRFMMSEESTEAYTAAQGGLVSLTHALAMSTAAYNITANCISMGFVTDDPGELSYSDHRQHPSGRVGKPDDIVKACLYLCDEQNDFINGQNIIVDGGMSRKMILV